MTATPGTPYPGRTTQRAGVALEPQLARGSVRRDYEVKPQMYASRGTATYLLVDPLQGHVVTMGNPGPDGHRGRDTVPYGPDLVVDSPPGKLTVPTRALPVGPKAPGRS